MEIYFKDLTHVIMEAGTSQACRRDLGKSSCCGLEPEVCGAGSGQEARAGFLSHVPIWRQNYVFPGNLRVRS